MEKNKYKKVILIIIIFLILSFLSKCDFHPILYIRYCFEYITNNSSEHFLFANSEIIKDSIFFENNNYDFNYYTPNEYFSNNPNNKTTAFDVTNFDDKYGCIVVNRFFI